MGGVTQFTDDININARINETATGRMLASARVTLSRTPSLENLLQTVIQEDYHQEKRVEEVQDATRLEIIPEGPTSIFPGESVGLRASTVEMVGGTEFISMVHARWSLAADSLQLASLSSSEGNLVVITALSSGTVTLRATYDTYSTTIQLEVKELPYLRDIAISPPLSAIYTGEVQEFTLKGFDQYGDPITASADWTILMGEGRLSRDRGESTLLEVYKAGRVVVQASAGGMTVAGSVEVLESPSVLTSLQVKPRGPIQLEEGESIRLSGLAFDQFQEEMVTFLNWSIIQGTGRLSSSSGEEITFTGSTSGTVVVKVVSNNLEATVEIQVTYRVSGQVLDEEGRGIPGVRVEFSGGYGSVTTDSSGDWSKSGLGGTVTVIPIRDGYTFTPTRREVQGEERSVGFTGEELMQIGSRTSHQAGDVGFHMRLAPASTFPRYLDDSGSAAVNKDFWIAETPVTYEVWYTVRMWALRNGYTFANAGREGSHGSTGQAPSGRRNEPVTEVNWYDSVVWCNALSEMLGYEPVYWIAGAVIKSASGISHTDVVAENRNGFRLPTSMEWELAARYKGSDSSHGAIEYPAGSGNYWTPGNYASGATADYNNAAATQAAAWYSANSGGKTQDVGQKPSGGNGLGVFDMSGNVWEWCFTQSGSYRVLRGGCWHVNASYLQVGLVYSNYPGYVYSYSGLRFLRTHF